MTSKRSGKDKVPSKDCHHYVGSKTGFTIWLVTSKRSGKDKVPSKDCHHYVG